LKSRMGVVVVVVEEEEEEEEEEEGKEEEEEEEEELPLVVAVMEEVGCIAPPPFSRVCCLPLFLPPLMFSCRVKSLVPSVDGAPSFLPDVV
jgi:hypothetical protein